jgi:hypothetical protein
MCIADNADNIFATAAKIATTTNVDLFIDLLTSFVIRAYFEIDSEIPCSLEK